MATPRVRAELFCERYALHAPILMAPMAGACPPSLAIAVANAGGLGACGALYMQAADIAAWVAEFRQQATGGCQLNLWIPDPVLVRDTQHEAAVRDFLSDWGPVVPPEAGNITRLDFSAQCQAVLAANPAVASSIMGLFPADFVGELKLQGIAWFATVSTVAEAKAAEAAGADVVVVQGMEAGGHRGCFDAALAEVRQVGLFSLLPAVVDAVEIPVVATGGIVDARGVAAALTLGASAVQIGTGFLRSPEAKTHPAWASALASTFPEDTVVTRAFSGRAARAIATDYLRAADAAMAPPAAPYPVQRGLTHLMRTAAQQNGDIQKMQAWAGQSAALATTQPAGDIVRSVWEGAQQLLP